MGGEEMGGTLAGWLAGCCVGWGIGLYIGELRNVYSDGAVRGISSEQTQLDSSTLHS